MDEPAGPERLEESRDSDADRTDAAVVLVVDDDPALRASIARSLTLARLDVTTAATGRDALRLVADGSVRPAVLLTDIDMPVMNGVELAARILALQPAVHVVMMTADADRAASARRHPSIVDAVLLKPVGLEELVATVRSALDPRPSG
jgi:CheY-like chemotaxis protein